MPTADRGARTVPIAADVAKVERLVLSRIRNIERKLEGEFVTDAADALADLRISVRIEFGRLKGTNSKGAHH